MQQDLPISFCRRSGKSACIHIGQCFLVKTTLCTCYSQKLWYKRYLLQLRERIITTIVIFANGKALLLWVSDSCFNVKEKFTITSVDIWICIYLPFLKIFLKKKKKDLVAQIQEITYLNVIFHLLWLWIFICHHFNPSTEGNDRDCHTRERKNAISDFSVLEVFQQMPFFCHALEQPLYLNSEYCCLSHKYFSNI